MSKRLLKRDYDSEGVDVAGIPASIRGAGLVGGEGMSTEFSLHIAIPGGEMKFFIPVGSAKSLRAIIDMVAAQYPELFAD